MNISSELSEFLQLNNMNNQNDAIELEVSEPNIFIWNRNRTLLLLELYRKYRTAVGSLKIKSLRKMYEIIAKEMENQLKVKVLPSHVENKWKVLERAYRKWSDENKKTGNARRDFEFANEMEEILEQSTSTTALNEEKQDSVNKENFPTREIIRQSESKRIKQPRTYKSRKARLESLKEIRDQRYQYYERRLAQEDRKIEVTNIQNKLQSIKMKLKRNSLSNKPFSQLTF